MADAGKTAKAATKFASPERSEAEDIERSSKLVCQTKMLTDVLEAFPEIVVILDRNRQIVYCNKRLGDFLNIPPGDTLGKRIGEIFGCSHSVIEPFGCGTSEFCRECGAAKTVLKAQKGKGGSEECRMTVVRDGRKEHLDLRVWSVPFDVCGQPYTMHTIENIADEKRKDVLQRTFFHDVLNEVTLLMLRLDSIVEGIQPLSLDAVRMLKRTGRTVVDTIEQQRDLLAAEEGRLEVAMKDFPVLELLEEIVKAYGESKWGRGRTVKLEGCPESGAIRSDRTLLGRVVGNLVKNALEASSEGDTVTVGCAVEGGRRVITVNNPAVMPDEVKRQVFQRSFSTKGKGRGIGTYSVKFISETYLGAEVSFASEKGEGTTFRVRLAA